jgi:hypothetical protein
MRTPVPTVMKIVIVILTHTVRPKGPIRLRLRRHPHLEALLQEAQVEVEYLVPHGR